MSGPGGRGWGGQGQGGWRGDDAQPLVAEGDGAGAQHTPGSGQPAAYVQPPRCPCA